MTSKTSSFTKLSVIFSLLFFQFVNPVLAQATGSGALSFNPTSFNATSSGTTQVAVVYTGTPIDAARVGVNIGSDLKIVSFTIPSDMTALVNEPTQGKVEVGKLSAGSIASGSTLFTMEVQALTCSKSGTISFNSTYTLIPDVTTTYSTASYTTNCSGGGTGSVAPSPTLLPKTGIFDEGLGGIVVGFSILVSGAMLMYYVSRAGKYETAEI